jgi:CheY-like chemotaxis protein
MGIILVVEDNVISARMLEGILRHHELESVTTKNGLEAMQTLRERNDIRLILLDLMMPEMDGFQFLEKRAASPRLRLIPVIVMTALADQETVRRVISMGCKHYVIKPIREDLLIPKIREMMPLPISDRNTLLRGRIEVMQALNLDEAGYDALFATASEQLDKLAAQLAEATPETFPQDSMRAFSEDVAPLCGQWAGKRLLALSENRALADANTYLQHLQTSFATALERRQRIRERISGQQQAE